MKEITREEIERVLEIIDHEIFTSSTLWYSSRIESLIDELKKY